jgi:LysR family cys regulon transcriptional activator
MAYDPVADSDLQLIDARHLFQSSITKLGFRRGTFIRGYMYDFIEMFSPHLKRAMVDAAHQCRSIEELDELFSKVELPEF